LSQNNRSRSRNRSSRDTSPLNWYKIDLHIHTPASADYQTPDVTLLDILKQAETRGADIIAFTDHNSIRGYANLLRDIEDLELLEQLQRITPSEQARLDELRRLMARIKVLPGVEFTATFGFHILGIFPETTTVRHIEHTLLQMDIPEDRLDLGSGEVGATTDVLSAYEILHEAGALVIPAHVNSTNGVAMQHLPFGGQTKIAFTQSPYIAALEATDMDNSSRRSTSKFFNGSKPDYPRRMHVIQGSDAHRLLRDPNRESNLGVGDRMTEVQLPEPTFAALKALFESDNFNRVKPFRPAHDPYDFIRTARAEGENIVQAFHEQPPRRGGRTSPIVRDAAALANGHGGTIYVGVSANPAEEIAGVDDAPAQAQRISQDIARHVTPPISASVDIQTSGDKQVIIVSIPPGPDKPYAVAPGAIYVRQEGETAQALRDEIVELVKLGLQEQAAIGADIAPIPAVPEVDEQESRPSASRSRRRGSRSRPAKQEQEAEASQPEPEESPEPDLAEEVPVPEVDDRIPRTGVEIVESTDRDGITYHAMRDLRNLKVVQNVTRDSARRLWRYAITQKENHPCKPEEVTWDGPRGFWKAYKPRGGDVRFNLVLRENGDDLRVFYGVTEEGMDSDWRALIPERHTAEVETAASSD
jgi:PHP family Zn ribbon phosphoesterase